MIDTVKLEWQGVRVDEGFYEWLQSEYKTPSFTTRFYDENLPWQGTQVADPVLGVIGTKSNKTGNYLWVERSLPKFLYQSDDNCVMLSVDQAREAISLLVEAVEAKFDDWLLFRGGPIKCKRVDFYHQRHIPSSGEAFAHIARCMKHRKVALHLSGVSINQSRWEHARFYDKGLESGNERYQDVVRHEEQLRGNKAGYYVDARRAEIRVPEAREQMNKRFTGWPSEFEHYDLGNLFEQEKLNGLAAGLLVLHPEYDQLAKRLLSNGTYYRLRKLALETQRRMVKLDLRLPDDAWCEPMVL